MTSSLRERRRQQLRDEILEAAGRLLGQKGYPGVSMDDLAAHVGISKPTLYSYFGTKDELIAETLTRQLERLITLAQTSTPGQTPLQRLVTLMEAAIRLQFDEHQQPLQPWTPDLRQVLQEHPAPLERLRTLDAAVGTLVNEAMAAGEIDHSLDTGTLVRGFFALITSVRLFPFGGAAPTPQSAIPSLVALFTSGVRPASER
ncbi:MAG: TetR/AcrR family transcriptional regulator [Roseiflexaceae bacterium]